jgi:hypothetical protein
MHRPIRLNRGLIAPILLVAANVGCPGTLEDPERFLEAGAGQPAPQGEMPGEEGGASVDAGNCPDVPQAVFIPNCTGASCHNAKDKAQGLDLQSPGVGARLVGAAATEGPGLIIDPSSPSNSVLYKKLTANPPFGARMPLGSMLDDATVACVLAWITEQASSGGSADPDAGAGVDAAADAGLAPESGP